MDQTKSRILDPVSEQPMERTGLATRPATLDLGRLDLLDPESPPDEKMIQGLEQRARFLDKVIQLALKRTSPSQYVIHRAEGDEARESVYPMGAAADAMFGFLGLSWAAPIPTLDGDGKEVSWRRGEKKWEAEIRGGGEDQEYYWVRSALWRGDQLIALAEGKRLIGVGYAKDKPTAEIDAFENLKSRAVREVLGLKAKDRAWYQANGLDLSNARLAEFQDRKSSATADPNEAVIKWGNAKGSKVKDLSDQDLAFYTTRYEADVADPAKAKFKPALMLAALKAEAERRAAKPTLDAQQAEELEQLIVAIREEAAAQNVPAEKLEPYIASLQTLEQAKKALASYRERRVKKGKGGGGAQEPGSQG